MKRYSLISLAVLFVMAAATARAATEYKFDHGNCDNGKQWWSVSTYLYGVLVEVDGVDCDGKHYVRFPDHQIVHSDPTGGAPSTFTGIDNGHPWYALVRYDDLHRVIWQGGMAADGTYWVTEINYSQEPGPGVN